MIPKVLTALISAAILSAILGALPCEATGLKHHSKAKAAATTETSAPARHDFNSPSMDFSGAKPVLDNPRPDVIPPKKDKSDFFD